MSSEDDLQTQKPNHPPQQLVSNFAPSENDHVSRCLSTYEMFFHPKMYQDQANPTSKRWNSIFWTIPNIEQPQKRIRTRKLKQNRSNLNKTSKAWKNISIKQLPFRKTKLRKTGKISCKTPHRLPIVAIAMASFLSALSELHDTLVASLSSCGLGLDGVEAKPELMRGAAEAKSRWLVVVRMG